MIKNLTPHEVSIVDESGNVIHTIESEPTHARLIAMTVLMDPIHGVPISKTVFGDPENLPPPRWACSHCGREGDLEEIDYNGVTTCCEGAPLVVYFIVSQMVKAALPHRIDLLVPAELVRDSTGAITGCRSLEVD